MRVASTCSYVHACPAIICSSDAQKKIKTKSRKRISNSKTLGPAAETVSRANKSKPRLQPSNPLNDSAGGQNATPANEKAARR